MTEFNVGDKVVPSSSFVAQVVYTIKAVGEPSIDGHPAWVTSAKSVFGQIINLEYMEHYFEPGYFRLKSNKTADAMYKTSDPGAYYERVSVVEYKEDEDV